MPDNTQLHILRCLCQYFGEHSAWDETAFRNQFALFDRHGLIELLETLRDEGFIKKLVISKTKEIIDVQLSYKGKTYLNSKCRNYILKIARWLCNQVGVEFVSSLFR